MEPLPVPKAPASKVPNPWIFIEVEKVKDQQLWNVRDPKRIIIRCLGSSITNQPIPQLSTGGGIGVALPYLDAAMIVPVDCNQKINK